MNPTNYDKTQNRDARRHQQPVQRRPLHMIVLVANALRETMICMSG